MWVALVAWLLTGGAAFAQSTGATLQGDVFDEQGAILPGASVTIENVETGVLRALVTDSRGHYRAAALPPGRYRTVSYTHLTLPTIYSV